MKAGICKHCGREIPYHRGRTLTICGLCRLNDHSGDPETCLECAKWSKRFDTMVAEAERKLASKKGVASDPVIS